MMHRGSVLLLNCRLVTFLYPVFIHIKIACLSAYYKDSNQLRIKTFFEYCKSMVLLCIRPLFSSAMFVTFCCYPTASSGGHWFGCGLY
jgi:ACR3 family arsenite efflux pump ArsB